MHPRTGTNHCYSYNKILLSSHICECVSFFLSFLFLTANIKHESNIATEIRFARISHIFFRCPRWRQNEDRVTDHWRNAIPGTFHIKLYPKHTTISFFSARWCIFVTKKSILFFADVQFLKVSHAFNSPPFFVLIFLPLRYWSPVTFQSDRKLVIGFVLATHNSYHI